MDFDFADRIDRYLELQDKVADLNAKTAVKTKPLSDEMSSILEELDAAMKGQNLFTAGGKKVKDGKRGVAEITESIKVNISDYEKLEQFIIRTKRVHLLERRVSSTAYKELKAELGNKPIPGISEFPLASIKVKRVK